MQEKYCTITIDVEPDCDVFWHRSNPLTFKSIISGVPKLLRPLWNKYNINPVYFVSPEVAENEKCCEILKTEIKLGAEIGTHLHAEYISPQKKFEKYDGTLSKEYPCSAYSKEIEFQKIKSLTELIEKNIGVKPISYRAARFGADIDTIESLYKLGYKIDSSVTPNIDWSKQGGPNFKNFFDQPYFVDLNDFKKENINSGILEVPITIEKKRLPFLSDEWFCHRWLRPSHMTVWEQKILINEFENKYTYNESIVLNMMFHSMEVIPGASPFVRTLLGKKFFMRRLSKIIIYLNNNNYQFITLENIYEQKKKDINMGSG